MKTIAQLCPGGVPRYVRCYDSEGESMDRYTVCYTGRGATVRYAGRRFFFYRAMSEHPCSAQGIGLYCETENQPCDTLGERPGWHWPPAIGRKCHLGRRIRFEDLPGDCRKLVLSDYKEIWKI